MSEHLLFFIHGITDVDQTDDYGILERNLTREYEKHEGKGAFAQRFKVVSVYWDKAVSPAEELIFRMCFPREWKINWFIHPPINISTLPAWCAMIPGFRRLVMLVNGVLMLWSLFQRCSWRYFSTYSVGDVIAYVDEHDNGIRKSILDQLNNEFKRSMATHNGQMPEFSIVGHSLGSVLAFDFAFDLLIRDKVFSIGTDATGRPSALPETVDPDLLRDKFRYLVTFGAPIALFMMRRDELWKGHFTNPVAAYADNGGVRKRWLNFYDEDDLVAYPVKEFIGDKPNANGFSEIHAYAGIVFPFSHTGYWGSNLLAKQICRVLRGEEADAKREPPFVLLFIRTVLRWGLFGVLLFMIWATGCWLHQRFPLLPF